MEMDDGGGATLISVVFFSLIGQLRMMIPAGSPSISSIFTPLTHTHTHPENVLNDLTHTRHSDLSDERHPANTHTHTRGVKGGLWRVVSIIRAAGGGSDIGECDD